MLFYSVFSAPAAVELSAKVSEPDAHKLKYTTKTTTRTTQTTTTCTRGIWVNSRLAASRQPGLHKNNQQPRRTTMALTMSRSVDEEQSAVRGLSQGARAYVQASQK